MRIIIQDTYEALSKWTASYIAQRIEEFGPSPQRPFVLAIPAGMSPLGTYKQLVSLHQKGEVLFKNVMVFLLDEYAGVPKECPQSHRSVLWNNLCNYVDIPRGNINVLDGNAADPEEECCKYEEKIKKLGGISLFLVSIGPDGHIGFNEPGSSLSSRTRVKTLTQGARAANARFFGNDINKVPKTGLTMGVATMMDAQEIVTVISGYTKARALQKIVEEGVNHMWTASMIQLHQHGIIVCDEEATMELKVATVEYFKDIEKEQFGLP